jgi:hypothetical protein
VVRFFAALALFAAWIGWLAYLAFTDAAPSVVSDPQLTAASVIVVAKVEAGPDGKPAPTAKVTKSLAGPTFKEDAPITVTNLPECQGFEGPDVYLLPLVPEGKDYRVTLPLRSPGIDPRSNASPRRLAIYRWTPPVMEQWERFHQPPG